MLGSSLLYAIVNQLCVHMHCLSLEPPTSLPQIHPPGHHRAVSWAPSVTQQLPTSCLFYTWSCIYISAPVSAHRTLPFPTCVRKSILYICISISALQSDAFLMLCLPLWCFSDSWSGRSWRRRKHFPWFSDGPWLSLEIQLTKTGWEEKSVQIWMHFYCMWELSPQNKDPKKWPKQEDKHKKFVKNC